MVVEEMMTGQWERWWSQYLPPLPSHSPITPLQLPPPSLPFHNSPYTTPSITLLNYLLYHSPSIIPLIPPLPSPSSSHSPITPTQLPPPSLPFHNSPYTTPSITFCHDLPHHLFGQSPPHPLNTLYIYPLPSNNNAFFFRENSIGVPKSHLLKFSNTGGNHWFSRSDFRENRTRIRLNVTCWIWTSPCRSLSMK